jgi:hypothetical protein
LVASRQLQNDPGGGRKTLGYEAAKRYRGIFSKCREDIQILERRSEHVIAHGSFLPWPQANQAR